MRVKQMSKYKTAFCWRGEEMVERARGVGAELPVISSYQERRSTTLNKPVWLERERERAAHAQYYVRERDETTHALTGRL